MMKRLAASTALLAFTSPRRASRVANAPITGEMSCTRTMRACSPTEVAAPIDGILAKRGWNIVAFVLARASKVSQTRM
jgi:hypothetical protein